MLSALLLGASPSYAGDVVADKARIDARFLSRLDTLVESANGLRLYATRGRLFSIVLRLDPENARARTMLGWKRAGKEWVRLEGWKEPHDWSVDAKPAFDAKLSEQLAWYRDQILALLEGAEPGLDPKARSKTLRSLARIMPEDRVVGEAAGCVEWEGAWVHPDTKQTILRRRELAALIQRVRKSAPTLVSEPVSGKAWKVEVRTPHILVRGTAAADEAVRIAREVSVAAEFMHGVVPSIASDWSPSEVYVFATEDDAKAFFLSDPRLGATRWKEGSKLSGYWIPNEEIVLIYSAEAEQRLLDAARQTIGTELPGTHGEDARGWVSEGLGQYLTWRLTGKHDAMFAKVSETGGVASSTAEADETRDWLETAARLLDRPAGPGRPTLRLLLSMRHGGITREAAFLAYAFAQYLEEARTDRVARFINANERSENTDAVCTTVLGMDAAALEERLREWLDDTR